MNEIIGDCPNLKIHVIQDNPLWKNIREKDGMVCQKSIISGKARIVSSEGVRLANGSPEVMSEKLDRLADDCFARKGDILGVSRNGLYEHYGVYIGEVGRVIHYCGEDKDFGGRITIHEAPFSEFLKDAKSYFVVWFHEGMPFKIQKSTSFLFYSCMDFYDSSFQRRKRRVYTAEEAVQRARSRLGEENYNLVTNNCEHFAMWCRTGIQESSQVKRMLDYAIASGITDL